jgi:hypothetical protein
MELSKGSIPPNNPSEAAHVALDQSNSKNISVEVPEFLGNQGFLKYFLIN